MNTDQRETNSAARAERHWQLQSEEISSAFGRSGLTNLGITGTVNSSSFIFHIRRQVNQGYARLRTAAQEFVSSLNIDGIRTRSANGDLQLVIPRSEDIAVPLLDLMAKQKTIPTASAVLGFAEDGSAVLHHFDSKDTPHLLVIGGKGAGKTVMLRSIAASLAINNRQSDIQLAAISPVMADEERQRTQAASWLPLNYLPHMLCDVAFKHTEIIDLLTFLSQEITYREKHSFVEPRLIVLIDQADVLVSRGGRQCAEPILHLAQTGEDVGIHLVLTSRAIDSATFSTQLLKELPTRLIGRPAAGQTDRILPVPLTDNAEQLLGEGDFLHRQGEQIQRLQGAFIDDYDLHLKLTEMYRHRAILLAKPAESRLRLKQPSQGTNIPWTAKSVDQVAAVAG